MLFRHPEHPGRGVRLAFCLNLHPAESLEQLTAGLREVTLPLRDRLAPGELFGVGMYLPAHVAAELVRSPRELAGLKALLDGEGLDAFTFNAFPYGGFHGERLKEAVFEPTWLDPRRLQFTLDVLAVASALDAPGARASHVSISTHSGGARQHRFDRRFESAFAEAALALARAEAAGGPRAVLAVEPEPRSTANDLLELHGLHLMAAHHAGEQAPLVARHMGTCLDTCHAAVEFESPHGSVSENPPKEWGFPSAFGWFLNRATLGKLQFTSALVLRDPASRPAARARLLALDEPRYLHQVTGQGPDVVLRVSDLPELAAALENPDSRWLDCDEWRCHFHVPVDLEEFEGLGTTRAQADEILEHALASPEDWGTPEMHVEIETYTWSLLPQGAGGPGALVDGLEREYRHVLALLGRSGWVLARGSGEGGSRR